MSADFTPEKEDYKILTPFKMQVLTNFPYIEADFDALTNYQLLCKIVEYLNEVIHNENEVTEQVNSLYNAYVSLQNYVNDYFDNLDIQEEINNKLDEMVEDGTMGFLLAKYTTYITPEMFDCVGDGIVDDTENMQTCLDYIGENHKTLFLKGLYLVNDLKLKAYTDGYVYNILGNVNKQKGSTDMPLKNGFITNTHVFNTDETLGTDTQIHFKNINAIVKDKTSPYSSFIEKCHLQRSSIDNCNITGFDYIINGSCNINTIIQNNNFKNVKKACFKVYDNSTYGFYDSLIQNNYMNAYHDETQGFHGRPSLRTCILLDNYRTGFGTDSRFVNNFVDYFTYFIDKGLSWTIPNTTPPTYSNKYAGLVSNNVFQNMLNMIGLGIILCGNFDHNLFDNFCTNAIYSDLNNTNAGPFSIATYLCEINENGDTTETFPYRKIVNLKLTNNDFESCARPLYYDFDYSSYPNVSSSSFVAENCIIKNNEVTSGNDKFNELSVFATQYNDRVFKNTECQLWDNICMPDTASNDYKVLHGNKLYARQGSIAQFSDGIFIAKYTGSRSYHWLKIADIT